MKKTSLILAVITSVLASATYASSQSLNMKPGTINFATLNTAVDNESTPALITATISHGKYKGAQLEGKLIIQTTSKSASKQYKLAFNSLRMHGHFKPVKITAYAIDPDTARTALTSEVDGKYLNRNATLLATSFIQSYSISASQKPTHHPKKPIPLKVKISSGAPVGVLFTA